MYSKFKTNHNLNTIEPLKVGKIIYAKQMNCPHAGSNYRPSVYKTDALPLSYRGIPWFRLTKVLFNM